MQCEDGLRTDKDMVGGAACPNFTLLYPYNTNDHMAKVMMYTRKYTCSGRKCTNLICTIPSLDLARQPTILIMDHYINHDHLHHMNYYNDVDDPTSLHSLRSLSLDPIFPTILIRDFNLQPHSWSPENIPWSPKTHHFKEWAASQSFKLLTVPGDIPRWGKEGECSGTLDLTFHNLATIMGTTITPPTINWTAFLGSDHAGIWTMWIPKTLVHLQHPPPPPLFDMRVEDNVLKNWHAAITSHLPPLTTLSNPDTLKDFIASNQGAIHGATEKFMEHKKQPPSHSQQCMVEQQVHHHSSQSQGGWGQHAPQEETTALQKALMQTTRKAKREWATRWSQTVTYGSWKNGGMDEGHQT